MEKRQFTEAQRHRSGVDWVCAKSCKNHSILLRRNYSFVLSSLFLLLHSMWNRAFTLCHFSVACECYRVDCMWIEHANVVGSSIRIINFRIQNSKCPKRPSDFAIKICFPIFPNGEWIFPIRLRFVSLQCFNSIPYSAKNVIRIHNENCVSLPFHRKRFRRMVTSKSNSMKNREKFNFVMRNRIKMASAANERTEQPICSLLNIRDANYCSDADVTWVPILRFAFAERRKSFQTNRKIRLESWRKIAPKTFEPKLNQGVSTTQISSQTRMFQPIAPRKHRQLMSVTNFDSIFHSELENPSRLASTDFLID